MKSFATTHWISKQISYQHYLCLSSIHASALIAFKLWYSLEHLIKFIQQKSRNAAEGENCISLSTVT